MTSTTSTLTTWVTDTQTAVTAMMVADAFTKTDQSVILSAFAAVIAEEAYVNTIITAIKQIMEDHAFTAADLPNVLVIMSASQAALARVITDSVSLATSLKSESMKYIIYGVMRFVFVSQSIPTTELDTMFSPLWALIAIDPSAIAVKVKKCFGGCCTASDVKTTSTTAVTMVAATDSNINTNTTSTNTLANATSATANVVAPVVSNEPVS